MSLAPELLTTILHAVGAAPAGNVRFTGADPVLPTRLRLGELGAAAIAAGAVLAARVHEVRTGESQTVRVAVDAAAAAMRSARYLQPDPPPPAPQRLGGLAVYRTRDGRWMYFQRLFPHHRERIAAALGCPLDEKSLTEAVARRDAQELEDAVVAAGACAAMVRTPAEWAAHPQSAAVATLPLVAVERIGDAPPIPLPAGPRPLGGLRVLDVTRVLAGPTAGRTLAEHGADVLRVGTQSLPDNDNMMRDTGHGKRSCALDLTSPTDATTLRTLVTGADVFVQGYRPGAMDRLGFAPERVATLRPGIVAVSISAFGHTGPWADRRGFDSIIQATNGIAHRSADTEGTPRFTPANPLDYVTGYLAAAGALAAVQRRAREGGSWLVRVSLARTGMLLADLPELPNLGPDLPPERLDQLTTVSDTPFGRLRHLAPVAELSATPTRWDRPTAPLDHDSPQWT
jgi:crotonobetainyl-CoA:carnitine CoA-transferase CaiB-like acyl-CoA transferase